MCMFYNPPTQKRIAKPITAYKVFTRDGKYPFQGTKPQRNKWLRARAPKGDVVQNYGFHVFTNKRDVETYIISWGWNLVDVSIRKVMIRGNVYGVGRLYEYPSGMRVSSMFFPKRKTKKK